MKYYSGEVKGDEVARRPHADRRDRTGDAGDRGDSVPTEITMGTRETGEGNIRYCF